MSKQNGKAKPAPVDPVSRAMAEFRDLVARHEALASHFLTDGNVRFSRFHAKTAAALRALEPVILGTPTDDGHVLTVSKAGIFSRLMPAEFRRNVLDAMQ